MKKVISLIMSISIVIVSLFGLTSCGDSGKEKVLIITSAEDFRVEALQKRLNEQFPDYDIKIEYQSTGTHAATLITEGKNTSYDISYDLEYSYLQKLADKGGLADLTDLCDFEVFAEDAVAGKFYIPEVRNGGAIIINKAVLDEKNLPIPSSYQDLLDPKYKNLISMPNPKSSGTGYMFVKNLVNAWGEEKAFEYFDKLSENVLSYTSSGSGPVNALIQKEVAIGLGMTSQAVNKNNQDNANLEIMFFQEGSPFSMYGQAILAGKETRQCVKDVFTFLNETYSYESCQKFYPEKIFKDKDFEIENFPKNIVYGDMSNDTAAEKERLLEKWAH